MVSLVPRPVVIFSMSVYKNGGEVGLGTRLKHGHMYVHAWSGEFEHYWNYNEFIVTV